MEPIVAFLLITIFLFIVLFPTIAFFAYIFVVLLPSLLFFWLYLTYFYEIMPPDLMAYFILISALLIIFPFLLFQIIAVTLGLFITKKLKNQQNHAFLLTKSAVGTFGKRLITYRKIFLFFFSRLPENNFLLCSTTMAFVCLNSHLVCDYYLTKYFKNNRREKPIKNSKN